VSARLVVTLEDISAVLDDHPRLNDTGNEVNPEPDRHQPWNTPAYRREHLRTESLEMVQRSVDWLLSHPCWQGTSYGGKHCVENDLPGTVYISNGAFIVAAVLVGRPINWGSRGAALNPEVKPEVNVRCRAGRPVGSKRAA